MIRNTYKMIQRSFFYFLLIGAILCHDIMPLRHAFAAGIQIYNGNTGTTTNYTGTKVIYTYNNKTIRMDQPGIIIDNIALASYEDLFVKGLGLTCTYHPETGKITVSEGENTIIMTLGSTSAIVNGKTVTMSVAPVKLRFVDYGVEKVYVPTRFVSENLGYSYVWVKASSTAKITKTMNLLVGDTPFEYNGTFYDIVYQNEVLDMYQMPSFSYHGVIMTRAKKLFETAGCSYKQTEDGIILNKDDITLTMSFNSKSAYVNGKKFIMEEALYLVTNQTTNISYAYLPLEFTAKMLGFDLTYNDAKKEFELLQTERTGVASKVSELVNYTGITTSEEDATMVSANKYFTWETDASFEMVLEHYFNPVHAIEADTVVDTSGNLYVYLSQKSAESGVETFRFGSIGSIGYIESEITEEGLIRIMVHNANTVNYGTFKIDFPLTESYTISQNEENNQVVIEFRLSKENYQYSLSLSDDRTLLDVNIYPNYITKVTAYQEKNSDVLALYGVPKDSLEMFDDNGMLVINLPYIYNILGEQFFYDTEKPYLSYCLLNKVSNGTRIMIQLKPDAGYYITDQNGYTAVRFTGTDIADENDMTHTSSDTSMVKLPDDKLLIPLPDGVTLHQVSDQDNYLNTNFTILVKGNYTAYYKENKIINPYSVIENYSISYNSTTDFTQITFDTKLICAYNYDISGGYLIVDVGRPNELYSKIVVLDAGHGGIDPGAIKNNTYEKNLNFTILNKYAKEYFDKSDIKVYYTRLTDVKIDLYERADFAAEVGADLFISLHMNANNSSSVRGTQVFYSSANNKKNASGLSSSILATALAKNLSQVMETKNRGISSSEFVVVKYNTIPAVLVELGFMTNASDFSKLTSASYQKKAAETIYKTVVQIFETYPTGR